MTQYALALVDSRPRAAPLGALQLDGRRQVARMALLESLADWKWNCGHALYLMRSCRGQQPGTDNFRRAAVEARDEAFRLAREAVP